MMIVDEKGMISNIPVINVFDIKSPSRKPMILILHGFSGKKEDNIDMACKLAGYGFFIVLFDAYNHGELEDDKSKSLGSFQRSGKLFYICKETSGFINKLIKGYQANPYADFQRVGLIGISMGGSIIYEYIFNGSIICVKAAVAVIAAPLRESLYRRVNSIKDFPLLMLNGRHDKLIPIADLRQFYVRAHSDYSDNSKIQFIEYKNIGHQVPDDTVERALAWFGKYLQY